MTLEIRTNRHWRNFLYRNEVPAAVLADRFDWLSEDDGYDGFFQYRGWWYHTSEFMACPPVVKDNPDDAMAYWDGYHGDSYFSGVVIKISRDGEQYQIGTYMS